MLRELFRIPIEISGVPLLGLGVLLAVWCVGGLAFGFRLRTLQRQGYPVNWTEWFTTLAIGAAAIFLAPRLFPEGLPIRGYGVMLLLALTSGVALALQRTRQNGISDDTLLTLVIWLVVAGIAGARAFHVVEYWEDHFAHLPLRQAITKALAFTEGGLVVYGSLVGAVAAFLVFVRTRGLPVLAMADMLAASLAVGLAVGRIGCLMNGCCYGGACDAPWAITFPSDSQAYADQLSRGEMHGLRLEESDGEPSGLKVLRSTVPEVPPGAAIVAIDGGKVGTLAESFQHFYAALDRNRGAQLTLQDGATVRLPATPLPERSLPVHPTQLYSAIGAGLLGWVLWLAYPLRRRDGEVIGLALTLYPIGRYILEVLRVDESSFLGTGLSISQNVSIALLLAMLPYWVWLLSKPRPPWRPGGAVT